MIDGTSGAGGLPLDAAQVDAYYFAPQKSFGSDGGLWLALLSPAAHRAGERIARLRALHPGVPVARRRARELAQGPDRQHAGDRDAATCSPSNSTGCSASGGLDWCVGRTRESSGHLYGWAERCALATPFVSDPQLRSLVVGTVDFDESVDAAALAATLRANGIVDVEPYRKLGRNQLRVAMFPGDRARRRARADGLHRLGAGALASRGELA